MTLDEYRRYCGWSLRKMARECDVDYNTIVKSIEGRSITGQTAVKLATGISKGMGQTIHWSQIEGLNVNL